MCLQKTTESRVLVKRDSFGRLQFNVVNGAHFSFGLKGDRLIPFALLVNSNPSIVQVTFLGACGHSSRPLLKTFNCVSLWRRGLLQAEWEQES